MKDNVTVEFFEFLPDQAKTIREEVFIKEQGFKNEFDDLDGKATHFLIFFNGVAVGTCRAVFSPLHDCHTIGRVAILKKYRACHLGKQLIEFAENVLLKKYGHIVIGIDSQVRACPFYEKLGYTKTNRTHLDEGCPHVWLEKTI